VYECGPPRVVTVIERCGSVRSEMAHYCLDSRGSFPGRGWNFFFTTCVSRLVLGPTEPSGNAGVRNALIVTFTPHLRHSGLESRTRAASHFITYYHCSDLTVRSQKLEECSGIYN
jgi:hypothetical protein